MDWSTFEVNKSIRMNNLISNLPALRASLGFTQDELAKRVGLSRQTIVGIENKNRKISWSNFLSILFIFYTNSKTRELLTVFNICE